MGTDLSEIRYLTDTLKNLKGELEKFQLGPLSTTSKANHEYQTTYNH
jgi:hypothetical protein